MKNFLISVFTLLFFSSLFSCQKEKNEVADDIYNTWEVVEFMSVESVIYLKDDNYNPVIEFINDGSFKLRLDVNSCFGSFNLSGNDSIEIITSGCTYVCCDSDFSSKFVMILSKVESYTINGNKMKLNIPDRGWINLKLHLI